MFNKFKDLFTKPETKNSETELTELEETQELEIQDEFEVTEETLTELSELKYDETEFTSDIDEGYIEHAAEVVGYANREQQQEIYQVVSKYFQSEQSVLDFGCGRGDFKVFYDNQNNVTLDYLGVDFNTMLIETGQRVYNVNEYKIDLLNTDWFSLTDDIKKDWCLNINPGNLRYDSTQETDIKYLQNTINKMMKHCNVGSVLILPSVSEGDLNNGELLNWCVNNHTFIAFDHTFSTDIFALILYK